MSNSDKYIGRWYNEKLNVEYYPDLLKSVADNTNIHLRRKNNRIGNSFQDITSKLEIISYHIFSINMRIELGGNLLPEMLDDLEVDISKDINIRRRAGIEKNRWIEFYDYVLISHIEGALIQSKALLDSIAQMYSIAFNRDIRTFSKSGKSILNDINALNDKFASYQVALSKVISEHKEIWIDETIKYRDFVVHYGQLREFRCPMLQLDERTVYPISDVNQAAMPNGASISNFSSGLLNNTHDFTKDVMKILFSKLTNDARESVLPDLKNKPARNSLCPCWSGEKYKNCHGKLA